MCSDSNDAKREPVRSPDNFLVFGAPAIGEAEIREVVDCLRSGWLGTGPRVKRFEEEFARYKKAEHAVAVNSGTAALHLSLLGAGVGPGDEVITTPMTFCATVNAIIHTGATPVLADIDPETLNIDPKEVEKKISPQTRAILPVHFGGRPCDMGALCDIAKSNDLLVIEDCAHAIEAQYRGQHTGTFGRFGCFSFYVTKNLVTGEGGMVLCRSAEDAERVRRLSLHGMTRDAWDRFGGEGYSHYQVVECGYKYNMMDLQAAIGIHQLERIENNWRRRKDIWDEYNRAFADLPLITQPADLSEGRHGLHLYTIRLKPDESPTSRDEFLESMTANNIGVGVHYRSLPEHPYYRQVFQWQLSDYPMAADSGRETVSLPLSPFLTDEDVNDVIEAAESATKCQ